MVTADPASLENLLTVQDHDLGIDRLVALHANLPERAELVAAEQAVAAVQASIAEVEVPRHELERTQKRLEDEVATLEARAAQENEKLYGGAVTAVKELQALQDELAGLAKRQGIVEDQIIEVMEEAEPLDTQLAKLAADKDAAEAEVQTVNQRLTVREAEVEAELEAERAARAEAQSAVPGDLLAEYERIRVGRNGVGVAKLNNRSCQGCFLELSAVEVDRLKKVAADELVSCEECGRILVR